MRPRTLGSASGRPRGGLKVSDTPPGIPGPHSVDGIRERAPVKGVKDSDNPTQPSDLVGKRGRAPAEGVKDSDISTQFSESTRGGGNKDTLGSGKGKHEQAPSEGALVSVFPSTLPGEDAIDTSGTVTGKRERAPAEGALDSDIPTQSIDKKSWLGGLHLAIAMDREVVKEHAQ